MKPLLLAFCLTLSAVAQSRPDPPLAPYRSAAHKAFSEEMLHADQPLCPGLIAPAAVGACLDASIKQSEQHLAAYRSALQSSIMARQRLLGISSLAHFQATERLWDRYSESQLQASGDMASGPRLVGSAEGEARIHLIRAHLQMLDRIYYTLMHDDCGACLVDH